MVASENFDTPNVPACGMLPSMQSDAKTSHRGGARPGAGRPPSGEARTKVTVSLTAEQAAAAQAVADDRSVSLAEAVRDLFAAGIKKPRRRSTI